MAASPADVEAEPADLRKLAKLLGISNDELRSRLSDTQREFVYLKRQLPPEQAERVVQLGIPGVFLQREHRRYYPVGEVMSHIIGFTGVDDKGQEALELAFEDTLAGKSGSRRVIKDRLGRIVEDVESIRVPQNGQQLRLSIDARIQYLAFRELKAAVTAHRARAGGIVVLDVDTGEILAMANLPAYNPNNRGRLDARRTRNRVVTDLFEPGSTLKPFTAAAAIEAGLFQPGSVIQTAPGQLTIGNRTIHDAHPQGALTVSQIIQKSSNVGTAKMGLALPSEVLWSVFSRAGFAALRFSGGSVGTAARICELEADRAGHDVVRIRHLGVADATRARLHDIRERRRVAPGDIAQARRSGAGHARGVRADRAGGAQHA